MSPAPAWRAVEAAHIARADELTAAHRERTARGERHPVEDFLFTYYSYKPAVLRRWHPGERVQLVGAADDARAAWRWYRPGEERGSLVVDGEAFRAEKALLVRGIRQILRATAARPAGYGCFGLHEWAMVYRDRDTRHDLPLRLGAVGTDAVVDAHELRCTHFDAFRFFTADAAPRNRSSLRRDDQTGDEQPGCLHAGMDLYKWAVKLGPLVPGELLLDAFTLARDIRTVDMAASPYDLTGYGLAPVPVERPEGKADYVRRQRGFATRGAVIRERLIEVIDRTA